MRAGRFEKWLETASQIAMLVGVLALFALLWAR